MFGMLLGIATAPEEHPHLTTFGGEPMVEKQNGNGITQASTPTSRWTAITRRALAPSALGRRAPAIGEGGKRPARRPRGDGARARVLGHVHRGVLRARLRDLRVLDRGDRRPRATGSGGARSHLRRTLVELADVLSATVAVLASTGRARHAPGAVSRARCRGCIPGSRVHDPCVAFFGRLPGRRVARRDARRAARRARASSPRRPPRELRELPCGVLATALIRVSSERAVTRYDRRTSR